MAKSNREGRPTIPLMPVDKSPIREDETKELTGFDAAMSEAEFGSAGNGADPYEGDLSGGIQPIEDEASGEDIGPDEVRRFPLASDEEEEEREITAQPNDHYPVDASELP